MSTLARGRRAGEGGRTTERQRACAAPSALVRSEPEHAPSMQVVTELTKLELLQRQPSSRGSQLPKSALVRHDSEQPGRGGGGGLARARRRVERKSYYALGNWAWRRTRGDMAVAETEAARARMAKKRMLVDSAWGGRAGRG